MEYIILWILSLFGLWTLISNILDSFYTANREGSIDIVLKVGNQEDCIEVLLRQLSRLELVRKIIVENNNSTDGTLKIIKEIQKSNAKIDLKIDT